MLGIWLFPFIGFACLAWDWLAWPLLAVASLFPLLRGFAELVLAVSASCGSLICLTLAWLALACLTLAWTTKEAQNELQRLQEAQNEPQEAPGELEDFQEAPGAPK